MLLAVLLAAAPVVNVEVAPTCAGIDAAEVQRVVSIELRLSNEHESAFATKVRADCDGTSVRLHVADAVSRKTVERTVELESVGDVARSRTLALAIVELITASWSELSVNPEPRVQPAGEAPPDSEREAARARVKPHPALRLLAEGTGEVLFGSPLKMWGAGVRIGLEPHPLLGGEVDLHVDHGSVQLSQGTVNADRGTLGVSASLRARFHVVGVKALFGLSGGGVLLSGTALADPHGSPRAGPWLGAHLGGAATLTYGMLCAELGAEVGVPIVGIVGTVDGANTVPLMNVWLGARLAIGITL
jgi:hypothetical protein